MVSRSWWPCPGTTQRRSCAPPRTSPVRQQRSWPPTGIRRSAWTPPPTSPASGSPCPCRAGRPARARRRCRRGAGGALTAWQPGELDLDIQARVAAALEARGADAPVLIVGGDERVRRYRHPMAVGAPARHLVDGRGGSPARRAARGGHPLRQRGRAEAGAARAAGQVRRIEAATLAASRPANSYGQALRALDHGYAAEGAAGRLGGPLPGRPDRLRPARVRDRPGPGRLPLVPDTRIEAGHAVAWNPSLPGGAKAEDTYLVQADGLERVTSGPGWPVDDGDDWCRRARSCWSSADDGGAAQRFRSGGAHHRKRRDGG